MEVYKITCKVNNKVYIGSTKLTKEDRWGDLSSSSSHLSCVRDNVDSPLYNDIREYGEDSFTLETLEQCSDRSEAYRKEDEWIKHYWELLGSSNIYNQEPQACGRRDVPHLHTKQSQLKASKARAKKYNTANGACLTPEAKEKARKTKMEKYGSMLGNYSEEARESQRRKVSYEILDTKDSNILYGYNDVLDKLIGEGYNISIWKVKRNIFTPNSKFIEQYPELLGRFKRM